MLTHTVASRHTLPLACSAQRALTSFGQLTGQPALPDGAGLLYERAFMLDLHTRHQCSANGSCRLLRCGDAMLAINLPRPSDWELIPAWLGPWCNNVEVATDDWVALSAHCQNLPASDLLQQARLLGLAVALASEIPPAPPQLARQSLFRDQLQPIARQRQATPLVVDLSSLWAGPLCSHLLQRAGCRVIKVEGKHRLDGARTRSPLFYHLLNQGKESVVLDFHDASDIERLKQLIAHADIVIEGSRPRALFNLGIRAEGRVWISITGYGREGDAGNWIGYGDDTAAAAGLCAIMREATGEYQFVGDAIADPLTGIHAALLAWQHYQAGGKALIALSLRDTAAYCLQQELQQSREAVLASCRGWQQYRNQLHTLFPEGHRQPHCAVAAAGQHNKSVFRELDA